MIDTSSRKQEEIAKWKRSLASFKKNIGKSPYIPWFIENIEKKIISLEK